MTRFSKSLILVVFFLLGFLSLPSAQDAIGRFVRIRLNSACTIRTGSGTPEAAVTGNICDVYLRTNGAGGTTLYVKESGSGNTGWIAPATAASTTAFTNKSGNISQWTNDSNYLTATTNAFQVTSVSLTDSQIKALPTTGITLVSAQGSGYRIKVLGATFRTNFTAGAYTNVNTTYATLQLEIGATWVRTPIVNDDSYTVDLTQATTFFNAAQQRLVDLGTLLDAIESGAASGNGEWVLPNISSSPTVQDNTALIIKMDNNGSGNLTGGNAGNVFKITVHWVKEALN